MLINVNVKKSINISLIEAYIAIKKEGNILIKVRVSYTDEQEKDSFIEMLKELKILKKIGREHKKDRYRIVKLELEE